MQNNVRRCPWQLRMLREVYAARCMSGGLETAIASFSAAAAGVHTCLLDINVLNAETVQLIRATCLNNTAVHA